MTGTQRRKQIIYQRRVARRAAKRAERVKQYGNFNTVFSFDHLYASYKALRTDFMKCADGVWYCSNAMTNLWYTYEKLRSGRYKFRPLRPLKIRKRGKQRDAWISCAEDRLVLYCLTHFCLKPIIEPILIFDCSSGITGKGPEFAMLRFEEHLHKFFRDHGNSGNALLIDVKDYYPSVKRQRLYKLLRKYIKDERIMHIIIGSEERQKGDGLLLGASTSTILSALYLSELDHFIKEDLRFELFHRHGDDMYLVHHDPDYLAACADAIGDKMEQIGLHLHPKKTKIVKLNHGWKWLKVRWLLTPSGRVVKRMNRDVITHKRQLLKKLPMLIAEKLITIEYKDSVWQTWLAQSGRRKQRIMCGHKFKHRFSYSNYYTRRNMADLYYDLFPQWEGCPDVLFQIDSQERRYTRRRTVRDAAVCATT